jgi:molecular chaperone GrpE
MDKHDKNDKKSEEENGEDESIQETDSIEEKLEEFEDKYKRALADYQNLEKRVLEDRREWIRSANRDLLLRLLPILDTLMLASAHEKHASLEVSIKQFLDTLKSEGVEKIETKGKDFDAERMEGVGTQEGDEGKVLAEVRAGYMLHDKLLRAAQVIVGKGKQASS